MIDTHYQGPATNGNGAVPVTRSLQTLKAKLTATLTTDATAPANNSTIVIGNKTYTFKSSLTPTEGEVLIGGTVAAAYANLASAINHTGTPDTDYKCALANPNVTAVATATTVVVSLIRSGNTGVSIALSQAGTSHSTWDTAALVPGITTTAGDRVLLKTNGASVLNPLFVELLEVQDVAFDGTSPVVSIVSVNVDGTGSEVNEFVIGDLSAGQAPKTRMITKDKTYSVRYTAATGSPTTGNIYSMARVVGPGTTS